MKNKRFIFMSLGFLLSVYFCPAAYLSSSPVENAAVSSKDILPVKVMYESSRSRSYSLVLQISKAEIQLQRFRNSSLATTATIPFEPEELEKVISGLPMDYFRGTVTYSNPLMRDGRRVRMITPLGDITEYGVFHGGGKWPQPILRLEALFNLFDQWASKLEAVEQKNGNKSNPGVPK